MDTETDADTAETAELLALSQSQELKKSLSPQSNEETMSTALYGTRGKR